ncbi:MAG: hypothetical protein AAF998_20230 [Bacteroidota bacterium]
MKTPDQCPRCRHTGIVKAGLAQGRQRYKCKSCNYHFTVNKLGKEIDPYYTTKSLQLYLEGLSYREIERIIGVSHVTISKWVRQHGIKRYLQGFNYRPDYRILSANELADYFGNADNLGGKGTLITEIGDKFMVIRWDRFR